MRSSISSSDFFARALVLLAIVLLVALGIGRFAGHLYRPQSLTPDTAAVESAAHDLALFGNSRFEAGIDAARLAERLSRPGAPVHAQLFDGGGWDALHYYMLALLARGVLRPGRDAVIVEVSAASLDDAQPANRLGTLRPEVARELAALPGEPLETRLDILCGAAAGLYRYRNSIQAIAIGTRLERAAQMVAARLPSLFGEPAAQPAYRLIVAPGRNFVMERVEGDAGALLAASRRQSEAAAATVRVGGFKLAALRRAVHALRSRGLAVMLVETPTSDWMESLTAHGDYRPLVRALADSEGAVLAADWPPAFHAQTRFWDDSHMVSAATADFTDALAARARESFAW